jgi:hypothetical protein
MKHLHLEVRDLATLQLLEALLAKFEGVRVVEPAHDETDYLLRSPANEAHLLRSLASLDKGESIPFDDSPAAK